MSELKACTVYAGMMAPPGAAPKPHEHDKYYFAPKDQLSPAPFSRPFDTFEAAERAAFKWEERYDLKKLGYEAQ